MGAAPGGGTPGGRRRRRSSSSIPFPTPAEPRRDSEGFSGPGSERIVTPSHLPAVPPDEDAVVRAQRTIHGLRLRSERDSLLARLITEDPGDLALHELLAAILAPGLGHDRAASSSVRLMCAFCDESKTGPLRRMAKGSMTELCASAGITPAAAGRLIAALELGRRLADERVAGLVKIKKARDVYERVHMRMRDLPQMEYWVLVLNEESEVIQEVRVSRGLRTVAEAHPREILGPVIRACSGRFILVHNQPESYGRPRATASQRMVTARLEAAATEMGLELVDHVAIGQEGYVSFAEANLIQGGGLATHPDAPERGSPKIARRGTDGPRRAAA